MSLGRDLGGVDWIWMGRTMGLEVGIYCTITIGGTSRTRKDDESLRGEVEIQTTQTTMSRE